MKALLFQSPACRIWHSLPPFSHKLCYAPRLRLCVPKSFSLHIEPDRRTRRTELLQVLTVLQRENLFTWLCNSFNVRPDFVHRARERLMIFSLTTRTSLLAHPAVRFVLPLPEDRSELVLTLTSS